MVVVVAENLQMLLRIVVPSEPERSLLLTELGQYTFPPFLFVFIWVAPLVAVPNDGSCV